MVRLLVGILASWVFSLPLLALEVGKPVVLPCTIGWTPPTQNVDGSPLTNLKGYQLFRASVPGGYPETPQGTAQATAKSAPCSTFGVTSVGQHYVAMKAVNIYDKASPMSAELAFEVIESATPQPPGGVQILEFTGSITGTMTITPTSPQ